MADDVSATGTKYEVNFLTWAALKKHTHKKLVQDLQLGPAVAPYPPPAPTYPEARDSLIDNEVGCSDPYNSNL